MSHPLYNPYASGNQSSSQGQYGLSGIASERDPRRASSRLGPGSNFTSSGASSATPANSGGVIPSLISQSMSYRPEQSRATVDEDIERSIDIHISRAREEVRLLSKPVHQPVEQGTRFTSTQRDDFRSSDTGMNFYPTSSTSASLGYRHSDVDIGSTSMNWSQNYNRPTADDSKFYSSSASSNYASGGDGRFNAPSQREHDVQSIPGLGDYDYPAPDKPAASTESSRPKYTSESASNILLHFGLEKEDLEHLIAYPEDQITPANLPFILRQIRIQKGKRTTTAVPSKPYPEPQPTRSMSGLDSHSLSSSGGEGKCQQEMAPAVLQPSKVIDYGHTGKYTGGVGEDIGRTSGSTANSGGRGSMLLMDPYDSSSHGREPRQKNTTEVKSSASGSSRDQASSVKSLSSSYGSVMGSVAPPSSDQTKRLQTQPNQTSQILSSFSLAKKDTDIRGVLKSEASKSLKESEAARQSATKTQPSCLLFRGVHPSRPGLVVIGRSDSSGTKNKSKTQAQESTGSEQMKKQQQQKQQHQQQPQMQQQHQQKKQQQPQMQKQMQQHQQKQPASQTGHPMWPPVHSAAKSVSSAPLIPSTTDASRAMQQPVFIPGNPHPGVAPPALPPSLPSLMNLIHMTLPPPSNQPAAEVTASKALPTLTMMHDYAAASPRIFPHTCSLCNKECTHMKDWISHQNTSLHLENCKFLRTKYPEWDGEIALGPRAAGKDAKPSASTSAQASQHRHQKTRHGGRSRSRSPSPRRHRGSEGRREKRSSRSRSPHSSRYSRRSLSRSHSPRHDYTTSSRYRSRSRTPERRSSPRRRDEKRSSPRRNDERRSSPRRSRERPSSPRRSRERRSSSRRSRDRRSSSSSRSDERRSSSRRSDERRSSSRRTRERRSSPWRSDDRRSSSRTRERRSSPRRSRERRSSTESSSSQQKKLMKERAEKLTKTLLEKSGMQSLSTPSDLEAVVKSLTPVLLAQLAKMKSPPSSSSSSSAKKKESTTKPTKAKPSLQKSEASSSTKTKSGKSSPPTSVRLQGILNSVSHNEVIAAVEHFGKTKSVVLFRSRLEAIVRFEKEEDAKKLKSAKTLDVKGVTISVVREKETEEQKKPPQKNPAKSSVSTPQTTTDKVFLTPNTPPLKEPSTSGAKKGTTGKLTTRKNAAKGSVKSLTNVTKAKVLVSKAKNVSTKQVAKAVKTGKLPVKGAVKKVPVNQKGSKSTAPQNQPDAGHSKQKPTPATSGTRVKTPAEALKEKGEVVETVQLHKADVELKDTEPKEPEQKGTEAAEHMEVGSCAEAKGGKAAATEAPPDTSSERQPPSSTAETLSEPQSTARGPETQTEAGAVQEQLPGGGVETGTLLKVKTPTDAASTEDACEAVGRISADSTEEAAPVAAEPTAASATAVTPLTGGEVVDKHLHQDRKDFEPDTINVEAKPPAVKCQTLPPASEPSDTGSQPASQTSGGPVVSEPIAAAPSDVAMKEDGEEPGSGTATDSTVCHEAGEAVEKVKGGEVSTADAISASAAPSAAALVSEDNFAQHPEISVDILKALTEALREHRLTRRSKCKSEEKENPSNNNTSCRAVTSEDSTHRLGQDDSPDDTFSTDTGLFDEQHFNMDDFVTIDEIGDDVEDTSPEPQCSSSSKQSSRASRERRSSGVSSAAKRSSTRSSKDCKSSASSSSRSTKGSSSSNSNSASPKKSKHSSEPTKSPTKPVSSASVGKASSSSSSSLSAETSSSPGQKTQSSRTKSSAKASNTASSGCRSRSSSAAREREKVTSVETHPEALREGAKDKESAVAKSDHVVAAESIAAKTVESEPKIETSSEMHALSQGCELELSQALSVDTDVSVGTLEGQKKSLQEGKEDDADTHTEVKEGDDPTGKQVDGADQLTGPETGQTLHEESYQLLHSVDESKARPEEHSEMETDVSFQVLDSVTEDHAASGEQDSRLVQDDASTVKQLSTEDANPSDDAVKDVDGKDQETDNGDDVQVLETASKHAPSGEEDVKGKVLSAESCKDVESPDGRIPNEDLPLQDPDSEVTEQETFEILDSIDDQTATEDGRQKHETLSEQTTKEETTPAEEEEDTYQVIDSLEDQPPTAESETRDDKEGESTAGEDDFTTTSTSKSEETKKQDRTLQQSETPTNMDATAGVPERDQEVSEDVVFEIVDSVEDEPVQDAAATERSGRRRSARGKREDKPTLNLREASEKPDEATYKILDSVEDETASDEPTITRRSTRGKRERTSKKDASNENTKVEDPPTRRRSTPARESQEPNSQRTPKKDEKSPPKKSDVVAREEDATDETCDSVEEEVVHHLQPATGGKGRRRRPRKEGKTTRKDNVALKKAYKDPLEKAADEEEATYQILDSVEEETVDDQSERKETDKQTKTGAEEEPLYQIVDSLEDDPEEITATEESDGGRKDNRTTQDHTPTKEDTATSAAAEASDNEEESPRQTVDLEEGNLAEESRTGTKEKTPKKDIKKEDKSPTKSQSEAVTPKEKDEQRPPSSTLVNLDQVSEEEEDYPEDAAEEEALRKRQVATKEKQVAKTTEERRSRETERERGRTRREEEKVEELLTLDEVGGDEAREETAPESRGWHREITEEELQALVTLDEFVEEEEEEGKPRPLGREDESVESLNAETLVTLDEAAGDEEEKPDEEPQAERSSRSAKRKHDEDAEESVKFVTVDEVGEVEEEEEEKGKEVTTRARGRPKKKTRQTPVRKSARGKKASAKDERGEEEEKERGGADELPPAPLDASLDKHPPTLSSDVQKTDVGGRRADVQQPTLDGCVEEGEEEREGWSRSHSKAVRKRASEPGGPAAKRARSQSPCVAADFKLPPFKPNNPLGLEFVVPKSGFFCNLCSVFYLNESTAKDVHCSSQRHYDSLQKYFQKLEQKTSRSSTHTPPGSVSE